MPLLGQREALQILLEHAARTDDERILNAYRVWSQLLEHGWMPEELNGQLKAKSEKLDAFLRQEDLVSLRSFEDVAESAGGEG
jgi:NAD-dependent oxidoreductase involved in siderophore biosynthesis